MKSIQLTRDSPPPGDRPAGHVRLHLPAGAPEATQDELRSRSAGTREALVVWAGRPAVGRDVTITHLLGLDCEATRLRLVVPLPERVATLKFLRSNQLLAFADLHTHPGEAFLSDADCARPFGSRDGFYAIVVPDFAEGPALSRWAMYEAVGGGWLEVNVDDRIAS